MHLSLPVYNRARGSLLFSMSICSEYKVLSFISNTSRYIMLSIFMLLNVIFAV